MREKRPKSDTSQRAIGVGRAGRGGGGDRVGDRRRGGGAHRPVGAGLAGGASGLSLDPASLELLRCACEALQRADEAALVVSREGQVFRDRWGQVRPHPAAILERDHRAQAARNLATLGVSLEGG
jgi:hypothetical protein